MEQVNPAAMLAMVIENRRASRKEPAIEHANLDDTWRRLAEEKNFDS
jgi:hypothetical protein